MQVEGEALSGAETGARVRNAYATYLSQGDSPKKFGLIPNGIQGWHHFYIKAEAVKDEYAFYQLVGEVTAPQGDDRQGF